MQINQNLRDIRALKNIPQKLIADKMGLSQNTYSRLERGKIKMTGAKKKKAAEVLGVSEEFLETFHEQHTFATSGSQQQRTLNHSMPEESLEGFRAAIQQQQEEIKHLRADLALFKAENQQLRIENNQLSKLSRENAF